MIRDAVAVLYGALAPDHYWFDLSETMAVTYDRRITEPGTSYRAD
jgi:hypothetical protein